MRECFVKLVVNEDNAVVARARPSATIVVVRDASEGLEVLLLKRNPELVHMPGAWVFPGGKVDDSDTGETIEERARVAAARELMEEAGFHIDSATLLDFSHWLTPEIVKRRFATWFYLAVIEDHVPVVVDGSEIVDYRWLRPELALSEQLAGELQAPPPTLVTLTDIQRFESAGELTRMVSDRHPPYFFPKLHKVPEGMLFLYPGDAGYETDSPAVTGPRHRMIMAPGVFDYDRSFDWPSRT